MTLLGKRDGDNYKIGTSYLDLAELLIHYGSQPRIDLAELWKRIVFSIAVSNTDDHLRNHGFLLEPEGWRLSPAYDLNPNPYGGGLSLNIDENNNALNIDLALNQSAVFHLEEKTAAGIVEEVLAAVSRWKTVALNYGINRFSCNRMASAFFHERKRGF